jgi:hypothetical protein
LGDKDIRKLFSTPSLPLPIDATYSTNDLPFNGLHEISRPIEEGIASPLNQYFLNNTPITPQYLRDKLSWD